uniref:Uncharacterized protein n=1 Tax=Fusarium oxysporum (strain Fo5176) TaxID=660025 RepID=A0A0D2YCI5_FUSOF
MSVTPKQWVDCEMRKQVPAVPCYFHERPRDCSPKKVDHCRKVAMDACVEWVKKVLEEEIEKVETKISTLDPATREFKDSTESLAYLRSVQPGKPITKDQYMRKEYGESLDEFIFCSLDEAIEILTNGPCLLSMVIPAPPNTEEDYYHFILERAELEKQIAQLPSVDVYDSGKKSPERIPEKWSGQEAMLRFYSDDMPSINMLNIRIEIKTGNSRWMAKIPGYDIIPRVVEQAEREGVDLTGFKESMEVTLAASQGADTMAHVDHEGVATSIDMWMGLKIWMLSYDFSDRILAFWMTDSKMKNTERCPDDKHLSGAKKNLMTRECDKGEEIHEQGAKRWIEKTRSSEQQTDAKDVMFIAEGVYSME